LHLKRAVASIDFPVSASASTDGVLTIERPEQLKALGHPLRLRVLETLSKDTDEPLTNRDLAQRLGVDPGHLHFHVRMLLRAGLIELAAGGQGREKPYRAAARTVRVAPELSAAASDVQAAVLNEIQRGWTRWGPEGEFRAFQATARILPNRLRELTREFFERCREAEDSSADPLVLTTLIHPPAAGE
jgi:DNA-binding transcriptional ArsR family regulator